MRILALIVALAGAGDAYSAANLDQLAAMQTAARAVLDGASICPELFEGLTATARNAIPMSIEARIREKLGELTASERRAFFTESRAGLCAARCRCGIYASWIGPEAEPELSPIAAKILAAEKLAPLDEKRVAKCAVANRNWLCRHKDFRAIVREAKKITEETAE